MILANGVGGYAWTGADAGGFFGNPSTEMLVRWYQAAAFAPFFRAHAHIDTKRREPYLFDDPERSYLRDALRLRYSLLPALYTAFWDSSRTGLPIARPHYLVLPDDAEGFAVDDQYFIGETGLLIHPVVTEGATDASVYFAGSQVRSHCSAALNKTAVHRLPDRRRLRRGRARDRAGAARHAAHLPARWHDHPAA